MREEYPPWENGYDDHRNERRRPKIDFNEYVLHDPRKIRWTTSSIRNIMNHTVNNNKYYTNRSNSERDHVIPLNLTKDWDSCVYKALTVPEFDHDEVGEEPQNPRRDAQPRVRGCEVRAAERLLVPPYGDDTGGGCIQCSCGCEEAEATRDSSGA